MPESARSWLLPSVSLRGVEETDILGFSMVLTECLSEERSLENSLMMRVE